MKRPNSSFSQCHSYRPDTNVNFNNLSNVKGCPLHQLVSLHSLKLQPTSKFNLIRKIANFFYIIISPASKLKSTSTVPQPTMQADTNTHTHTQCQQCTTPTNTPTQHTYIYLPPFMLPESPYLPPTHPYVGCIPLCNPNPSSSVLTHS